jgi:hypothetical protein
MPFNPFLDPTAPPVDFATPGGGAMPPPPTSPYGSSAYLQGLGMGMPTVPAVQKTPVYNSNDYTYGGGALGDTPVRIPTVNDKVDWAEDLVSDFRDKSAEQHRKWALWLAIGGFLPGGIGELSNVPNVVPDLTRDEVEQGYESLVLRAADLYAQGVKVTPEELLKREIQFRLAGAGVEWDGKLKSLGTDELTKMLEAANGGEESQAGTFTTTTKSLDFMDPMDAKALARGVLQQELGRDPTQAEYEDFISAIHAAERHDPSTTRTTYTTDDDGRVVDQRSVTREGMGAGGYEQLAIEKARRNPGWAEWQAVGTYAPALFAALGATVPGV